MALGKIKITENTVNNEGQRVNQAVRAVDLHGGAGNGVQTIADDCAGCRDGRELCQ